MLYRTVCCKTRLVFILQMLFDKDQERGGGQFQESGLNRNSEMANVLADEIRLD